MILLIDIGNTSTKVATYDIITNKVKNYSTFLSCKKNTIKKIIKYKKNKKLNIVLYRQLYQVFIKLLKKI